MFYINFLCIYLHTCYVDRIPNELVEELNTSNDLSKSVLKFVDQKLLQQINVENNDDNKCLQKETYQFKPNVFHYLVLKNLHKLLQNSDPQHKYFQIKKICKEFFEASVSDVPLHKNVVNDLFQHVWIKHIKTVVHYWHKYFIKMAPNSKVWKTTKSYIENKIVTSLSEIDSSAVLTWMMAKKLIETMFENQSRKFFVKSGIKIDENIIKAVTNVPLIDKFMNNDDTDDDDDDYDDNNDDDNNDDDIHNN